MDDFEKNYREARVAMRSRFGRPVSVARVCKRAVQVDIEVMRAFVRLRQILSNYKELARKVEELEGHGFFVNAVFHLL